MTRNELNIVIIEDAPRDAEAIEAELREAAIPFRAQRLETREQFLARLQSQPPDVVLSDFTLPSFDAMQALRMLHAIRPEIPFILVTGSRSEEVAVECIKEGADDYILKASLKRLPMSILHALGKKAAEQAKARAEAALGHSEEQFRLIAENSRDLISLVDLDGRFVYASPSFCSTLGYSPETLKGTSAFAFAHPDDQQTLWNIWQEALAERQGRTTEFRARHANGEWRVLEAVGNWIFDDDNQPQRSVVVFRDVTQRRQAEDALREMPRLIREAQESERHRVARELHDSVNQILSSVKFRFGVVEEKLAKSHHPAAADALKARLLLERTMQEVRRISQNLRPSELDDLGLMSAVRSLCTDFAEHTGLQVAPAFSRLPKKLPEDVELHVYRIVQEALNNVTKHARATQVEVRLAKERGQLKAMIRDNGCGFDPAAAPARNGTRGGMGLTDMRERAALFGGDCDVHSATGQGTTISVCIPLKERKLTHSPA